MQFIVLIAECKCNAVHFIQHDPRFLDLRIFDGILIFKLSATPDFFSENTSRRSYLKL
jgi:hypothetical protein